MDDQRAADRLPTFLKGTLLSLEGETQEHVTIRNLSQGGARLSVTDGWRVPGDLLLEIPARQERHRVHVRWRLTEAVGVLFTERMRTTTPRPDMALRLLDLEREVRRLTIRNRELARELSLFRPFDFDQ
jgi:hypothetical protein